MTQLAAHIGVSYQQLHKNEMGTNHVSVETLYHLSLALNISPDYFFDGLDDENSLPVDKAAASFSELAMQFVRLNNCDQKLIGRVARLFARERDSLAVPDGPAGRQTVLRQCRV